MMNKQNSLESQFNKMADDGTPGEETGKSARSKRTRGRIVEYQVVIDGIKSCKDKLAVNPADQDAAEELKTYMELFAPMKAAMDPIDKDPSSFPAIINFGALPIEKLGKVAKDMLDIQKTFTDQVNVMGTTFDRYNKKAIELGFKQLGTRTKAALKNMAAAGSRNASKIGHVVSGIFGKNKQLSEDQQFIADMQAQLPQMSIEMNKLIVDIKALDKGLLQVIAQAEVLGQARIDATREIGVYLGVSNEIMRRYKADYIAEAERDFKESGDPDDKMYLEKVLKRQENFEERYARLESSRAQSLLAAQQLQQMIGVMEDQRTKIADILTSGQNEWMAMLAGASLAGSSLKSAQILKTADDLGDAMHDQSMLMIEEAQKMTLASKARGTVDPQKIIDSIGKCQELIENENAARQQRLIDLREIQVELRGAADKLLDAAEKSSNERLLEAQETVRKSDAAAGNQQPPAANNNTPGADVSNPPRKAIGGGKAPKIL